MVKVLIVDSQQENGAAAKEAIPGADVASSTAEAIAMLNAKSYDFALISMKLERSDPGLEVTKAALQKSVIPYTVSYVGTEDSVHAIEMQPSGCVITIDGGKANPETWKLLMRTVLNATGTQLHYHSYITGAKATGRAPDVEALMSLLHQRNADSKTPVPHLPITFLRTKIMPKGHQKLQRSIA